MKINEIIVEAINNGTGTPNADPAPSLASRAAGAIKNIATAPVRAVKGVQAYRQQRAGKKELQDMTKPWVERWYQVLGQNPDMKRSKEDLAQGLHDYAQRITRGLVPLPMPPATGVLDVEKYLYNALAKWMIAKDMPGGVAPKTAKKVGQFGLPNDRQTIEVNGEFYNYSPEAKVWTDSDNQVIDDPKGIQKLNKEAYAKEHPLASAPEPDFERFMSRDPAKTPPVQVPPKQKSEPASKKGFADVGFEKPASTEKGFADPAVAQPTEPIDVKVQPNTEPGATATIPKQDMAPGVKVVSDEPIILQYKKKDFGLNDQGRWVHLANGKAPHEAFQTFLSKQHDISLGMK